MMRRITAAGFAAFGAAAVLFWFAAVPHLKTWRPSPLAVGLMIAAVGMVNIAGLIYLIGRYREHPRWLVAVGIAGNGLSLFVIAYAAAGMIFLEYFFRM
jgi:hypothetical protein